MPHPDYLLRILTAHQLAEWEAYSCIEPFGEERADLRSAIVACANYNALWQIHAGKKFKPLAPRDFMAVPPPLPKQPVKKQQGVWKLLAAALPKRKK